MGIAKSYTPDTTEMKFNQLIDEAIEDYHMFIANANKNPTTFTAEVFVNFTDLFDVVIDMKKRAIQAAAATANDTPAGSTAPNEAVEQVPTTFRRGKK